MATRLTAADRHALFVLSLGAFGGAALVVTERWATKGPLILLTGALLLLVTGAFLVGGRVQPFAARFGLTLGVFAVATATLYLYIVIVTGASTVALGMPLWGHSLRVAILLALGSILSVIVAQLTGTGTVQD